MSNDRPDMDTPRAEFESGTEQDPEIVIRGVSDETFRIVMAKLDDVGIKTELVRRG